MNKYSMSFGGRNAGKTGTKAASLYTAFVEAVSKGARSLTFVSIGTDVPCAIIDRLNDMFKRQAINVKIEVSEPKGLRMWTVRDITITLKDSK